MKTQDKSATDGKSTLLSALGQQKPRHSVAQIDSFITMLGSACENRKINAQLEHILALPDAKRKAFIHNWVSDMLIARAPTEFVRAIACLEDDRIAEKVYEVIYQCKRKS